MRWVGHASTVVAGGQDVGAVGAVGGRDGRAGVGTTLGEGATDGEDDAERHRGGKDGGHAARNTLATTHLITDP